MKKKSIAVISIVLLFAIGVFFSGKYAYDYFMNKVINDSFTAMMPELEALNKEQNSDQGGLPKANADAQKSGNNELTENNVKAEPSSTPIKKVSSKKIMDIIEPNDRKRAESIVSSVVPLSDLPRLYKLYASKTPEARKELKAIKNKFSSAQINELLSIYNKYKEVLK